MTAAIRHRPGTAGAAAVAVALLAGCAAQPLAPLSYRCSDDTAFSLAFDRDAGQARMDLAGLQFVLRREPAASGLRYTGDVLSVWIKGDAAQIDIQGSVRQCYAVP
jgi:membrane-bound inhibitor of C-type lysozyme